MCMQMLISRRFIVLVCFTRKLLSRISIIDCIICYPSAFAIMRVLSALLSSLPNESVTLVFIFFNTSFIDVICLLQGQVGTHHFAILVPQFPKSLLFSIDNLSSLLYCKYGNCEYITHLLT